MQILGNESVSDEGLDKAWELLNQASSQPSAHVLAARDQQMISLKHGCTSYPAQGLCAMLSVSSWLHKLSTKLTIVTAVYLS